MSIDRPSRFRSLVLTVGLALSSFTRVFGQGGEQRPPAVRHHLVWRDDCLMCHRPGAIDVVPDVPESHRSRPSPTCLWCHAEAAALRGPAPPIPHEIERRSRCLLCHTAGRIVAVPDMPAYHNGIGEEWCVQCHERVPSGRP